MAGLRINIFKVILSVADLLLVSTQNMYSENGTSPTGVILTTPQYVDITGNVNSTRLPVTEPNTTPPGCHPSRCRLPNCLCAGKSIPGAISPMDTPQMVVFTFDDAVNEETTKYFEELFNATVQNPNGCPISMTFFVSHLYTNYCSVSSLWRNGHEVASHSISHRLPSTYWRNAPSREYDMEVTGQRLNLIHLGGLPEGSVKGYRSPFLQPAGDTQFTILRNRGFTYDASLHTVIQPSEDFYWPYTLDWAGQVPCQIRPCPHESYPGLWEVPVQTMRDSNGGECTFWDNCPTEPTSIEEVFQNFMNNFRRSYERNRAPVVFSFHAEWFGTNQYSREGLKRFITEITHRNDVWIITINQALEWIRNPTPLTEMGNFVPWQCNHPRVPGRCMSIRARPDRNRTRKADFENYKSTLQDPLATRKRLNDRGVAVLVVTALLFGTCYVWLLYKDTH